MSSHAFLAISSLDDAINVNLISNNHIMHNDYKAIQNLQGSKYWIQKYLSQKSLTKHTCRNVPSSTAAGAPLGRPGTHNLGTVWDLGRLNHSCAMENNHPDVQVSCAFNSSRSKRSKRFRRFSENPRVSSHRASFLPGRRGVFNLHSYNRDNFCSPAMTRLWSRESHH